MHGYGSLRYWGSRKSSAFTTFETSFLYTLLFQFQTVLCPRQPTSTLKKKLLEFYVVILIYKISPAKFISGVTLQAPVCL